MERIFSSQKIHIKYFFAENSRATENHLLNFHIHFTKDFVVKK